MSNGKAHRSVAYRKKLQDEKKRKDKEARVSDAKRMASVETEMDRTKSRNLAQKQAVEQDDWSLYKDEFEPYRRRPPSPAPGVKPPAKWRKFADSPWGRHYERQSAGRELRSQRRKERMDDPSYKSKPSTRPDKELGRKTGGYVKKYARGGGVLRKAR